MNGGLKDILQYNPYIDEVIMYQTAFASEYDCVLDVTSVCIGREKAGGLVPNRIDLFAEYMGVSLKKTGYLPDYIVSDEEKEWAQKKLARYPLRRSDTVTVGIQARASTMARSWPLEKVRELAVRLYQEHGMRVVVFDSSFGQGSMEDWNIVGVIPCLNYDIRHTAALINEMDLVIAPDSGLMHIAGALNKRLVTIWAGTDYRSRINHYPNASAVVRDEYKCWPCWYSPSACQKQYTCIRSISVDEVIQAVLLQLKKTFVPVRKNTQGNKPPIINFLDNEIQKSRKILINRCSGLGDIVMCTALTHELHKKYPFLQIYFRTNHPEVFRNNPDIHGVIKGKMETSAPIMLIKDYGLYLDLNFAFESTLVSGNKGKLHEDDYMTKSRLKILFEQAGIEMPDTVKLVYKPTKKEYVTARKVFSSMRYKKNIVYTLNSLSPYRTYPIKHSIAVISALIKKYNVIVIGNSNIIWQNGHPFTKAFTSFKQTIPKDILRDCQELDLRDILALVAYSDVVVTPDTGVLHVAAATNTPCVALFGNIDPRLRCEYYNNVTPLYANITCAADCGDRPRVKDRICPSHSAIENKSIRAIGAACMEAISPESVIAAVEEKLSNDSK